MSTKRMIRLLGASLAMVASAHSQTILFENFEDGVLDSRITFATIGTFSSAPGIKAFGFIEGIKSFGFGRSTNRFNSFGNYVTSLNINFTSPTYVTTVSFDEMEVFANWGSGGDVYADGQLLAPSTSFGHLPYNSGGGDTTYRSHSYPVNRTISRITLGVADITDLSEIYIDRLTVNAVPEPSTAFAMLIGLAALGLFMQSKRHHA